MNKGRARRWAGIAAIGLLAAATAAAKPPQASEKVEICHHEGDGEYHAIEISVNAEQKHRDNHGDGAVGDAVPGMDGYTFDDDCVPVRNALVRAVSTDSDGNERLIAELLDTNGDGVPSIGDTVRTAEYPRTLDGTDYGGFTVTEHVLDSYVYYDSFDTDDYWQRYVYGGSTTCVNCEFWWDAGDFTDYYGYSFEYYYEYDNNTDYLPTFFVDYGVDCSSCNDQIYVDSGSPSVPGEDLDVYSSNERDDFVDLIWNY